MLLWNPQIKNHSINQSICVDTRLEFGHHCADVLASTSAQNGQWDLGTSFSTLSVKAKLMTFPVCLVFSIITNCQWFITHYMCHILIQNKEYTNNSQYIISDIVNWFQNNYMFVFPWHKCDSSCWNWPLTYCGLMTPYVIRDLGKHWFK